MKTAPAAEVKLNFSEYLRECREEPVVVTEDGKAVAVLVPAPEDDDLERLVLACNPRFRRLLEAAKQRLREGGGIRHEDFWQSLE